MEPGSSVVTLHRPRARGGGPAVRCGPGVGAGRGEQAGSQARRGSGQPAPGPPALPRAGEFEGSGHHSDVTGPRALGFSLSQVSFLWLQALQKRRGETLQKAGPWARSPQDLEPWRGDKDDAGQDPALGQRQSLPCDLLHWAAGGTEPSRPGGGEEDKVMRGGGSGHSLQGRESWGWKGQSPALSERQGWSVTLISSCVQTRAPAC